MTRLVPRGLRTRLVIALVGIAAAGVGTATVLSNLGLEPRLSDAARARLAASAERIAKVASRLYEDQGPGWARANVVDLEQLSEANGLSVTILDDRGSPIVTSHNASEHHLAQNTGTAAIDSDGKVVGTIVVAPLGHGIFTAEETDLRHSLDRLHLVAGAIAVATGLIVALVLAQTLSAPLRRIRTAADRIAVGHLGTRLDESGSTEVRAVSQAINRLADTLEQEENARRQSVADLAHELRTPVSGILTRIEAAQDGVLADAGANLAAMHGEALRLVRLLDDIDALADAQRPGLFLERENLDLAEIAAYQIDALAHLFSEKRLRVVRDLTTTRVDGDPDRLSQIVSNLLSNACRYTPDGGTVTVTVRAADRGHAMLEVADTGVGIAVDDQPRVFTRFWRKDPSRSRATGGAGIGLAIVSELVRSHDGRIELESTPGVGSTFRILLPLVARPELPARQTAGAIPST